MSYFFENKSILSKITKDIVDSYRKSELVHLDHCPLPNYNKLIGILDDLKEVLYPGYRGKDRLQSANIEYYTGDLIDRLHDKIAVMFERALCHGRGEADSCQPEKRASVEQTAYQKTLEFLKQIPELRRILATDVEAAYAGDPACKSFDEVVFCYPGLEAITIHRLAHVIFALQVPLIPRMMSEYAHSKTGIDIHPGATIGEHFFIDHGTGVVIGETTNIGNWVKLYQGVTLGALSFQKDGAGNLVRNAKRHPTIEDNVVIYANATVLGGKTVIGHDAVIGSSVWITASVPASTTVLIEKPALIYKSAHGHQLGDYDYVI